MKEKKESERVKEENEERWIKLLEKDVRRMWRTSGLQALPQQAYEGTFEGNFYKPSIACVCHHSGRVGGAEGKKQTGVKFFLCGENYSAILHENSIIKSLSRQSSYIDHPEQLHSIHQIIVFVHANLNQVKGSQLCNLN